MIKQFNVHEEIVKQVVPFGNGSIVFTPKKWVGQTVRVILEQEPINIKEDVLKILHPFLEQVEGIYLFGSFARNEQTIGSDIDVLVIASKKFKLEKKGKYEFIVIEKNSFVKELLGKNPLYFYSIAQEAKPILNESLLNDLKQVKIKKQNLKWIIEEGESALKIVEEFLKLDKMEQRKNLDSISTIYSMILRLRSCYLIHCFIEKQKSSNKEFKNFLFQKGISKKLVEEFLEIYNAEKLDKKISTNISLEDAEQLFQTTKNELQKLKKEVQ
ncbi:MAG: DUF2080 family transposase-associated protein [archaeon]|nr:DUF2080 family transposase-associated protein [archaeon]